VLLARLGQALSTSARHILPAGGIFAADWHPATAMAVYWVESVLLALAVSALCAIMDRRTSPAAIARARSAGDHEEEQAITAERLALNQAQIKPGDVFGFHVGSLIAFAAFLGGVLLILVGNGHVEPLRWPEIRDGALAMLVIVSLGFLFDLWRFDSYSAADLRTRVDACLVRWGLFWMLGFFGTLIMALSGRPLWFLGLFSVLKITFESWARLARLLRWRSVKDQDEMVRLTR
jgi:hypothetical protein